MARLARLSVPGHPHHVILRGHSGANVFRDEDDFRFFLGSLREAAAASDVAIHAYVLMPNHVHLLMSPPTREAIGQAVQSLGRRYVRWFNQKHKRTGTLWDGRYRSALIEAERYLLPCSLYIELNPVRSGLVGDAADYPWSSLGHHLGRALDPLITDHPIVWALGNTPFDRQAAYLAVLAVGVSQADLNKLRWATHRGWAIGTEPFLRGVDTEGKRPLSPGKRGRPRKQGAGGGPHSSARFD